MLKLDEFESVFRSASKERYVHEPVSIRRGLLVTALFMEPSRQMLAGVREHLSAAFGDDISWEIAPRDAYYSVDELLERVREHSPDLVCTHRNLSGKAGAHPYSLGSYVDVLTQAIDTPVLLVPTPDENGELANRASSTDRVMVLTDDLTHDEQLIRYAAAFTAAGGTLFLAHLEDERTFRRYIDVISKVPDLDTDLAKQAIERQLLKEPDDYIESCRQALSEAGVDVTVHGIVEMGHQATTCKRLVHEHEIDLVVMNTKDDEQLAMQGLAYTLSIELRDISLLLL